MNKNDIKSLSIDEINKRVRLGRIDRCVINSSGDAVPTHRAREDYGINPDIIFIRNDGWMLSAPQNLESVAFSMWSSEWSHFWKKGTQLLQPISEY